MSWLASLFKKEEIKPKKAFVPLSRLAEWFEDKSEPLLMQMKHEIKGGMDVIEREKAEAQKSAKILSEAELMNPNMPPKALHMMEGNRDAYIIAVNNFLSQIKTPTALTLGDVREFLSSFEDNLSNFTKSSARNYHVLREFFANESSEVLRHIHALEAAVRGLTDNKHKDLEEMQLNIEHLNKVLKAKKIKQDEAGDQEAEMQSIDADISDINRRIEEVRKTKDYKEYEMIEQQRKDTKQEMKKTEAAFSAIFSPLDKALRKYSKISPSDEKIINPYLESPLNALTTDSNYAILDVLSRAKEAAAAGLLEMDDKKKEKAVDTISGISQSGLEALRAAFIDQKESLQKFDKRERISTAAQKLSELSYKLSHLQQMQKVAELKMTKTKKHAESITPDKIIVDIEKQAESALGIRLKVTGWDETSE